MDCKTNRILSTESYGSYAVERFKENFPFFLVMGMSDEEMRKQLEESLETGKPFRPEMDPDKIY